MAYEDETEEDTRAERIEPALRAAGWGVVLRVLVSVVKSSAPVVS